MEPIFKELEQAARKSFEMVCCIDLHTEILRVLYDESQKISPEVTLEYAAVAEYYVEKNVIETEQIRALADLRLDRIREMLESASTYRVFVTVLNRAGQLAYKRLTFFYHDAEHRYIVGSQMDVSGVARRYETMLRSMRRENFRDVLTDAYNRNYYETNIRFRPFSGGVIIIDLDDLKLLNDSFGHKTGDEALSALAKLILPQLGKDDILVRYGGDEFLVFQPDVTAEAQEALLHNLREGASQLHPTERSDLTLSFCAGAVTVHDMLASEAVSRADRLLYRAKAQKNCYVTERGMERNDHDSVTAKPILLITDDSELNRMLLSDMLRRDFQIIEAEDGLQCLAMLESYGNSVSLLLLDILMPRMDGFEVLAEMNRTKLIEEVPVVLITVDNSDSNLRRAYEMGVADCIGRPFDSRVVYRRIHNVLRLYGARHAMTASPDKRNLERVCRVMTQVLGSAFGASSGENSYHLANISRITELLLERLLLKTERYGLVWKDCALISMAAALHDIGKFAVDRTILGKPGKLTPEEFEEVKLHTIYGEQMLRSLDDYPVEPVLKIAADICRWHHERYDGGGYPDRLKGDAIPIAAQVVSLADVYDALVSKRVYKEAYSHETAIRMIFSGECGSFNPLLLECLRETALRIRREIYFSNH